MIDVTRHTRGLLLPVPFAVLLGWCGWLCFAAPASWTTREIAVEIPESDIVVRPTLDVDDGDRMTLWVSRLHHDYERSFRRARYDEASETWTLRDVQLPEGPHGYGSVVIRERDGRINALAAIHDWERDPIYNYSYIDLYDASEHPDLPWRTVDTFAMVGGRMGGAIYIDFHAFYRDGVLYGHHTVSRDRDSSGLVVTRGPDESSHRIDNFSLRTLALDHSRQHALVGGLWEINRRELKPVFYVLDRRGCPTIGQHGELGSAGALASENDGTLHAVWFDDESLVYGRRESRASEWEARPVGPRGDWTSAHIVLDHRRRPHFIVTADGRKKTRIAHIFFRDGRAVEESVATVSDLDTQVVGVNASARALHIVFQRTRHSGTKTFHHATRRLD